MFNGPCVCFNSRGVHPHSSVGRKPLYERERASKKAPTVKLCQPTGGSCNTRHGIDRDGNGRSPN
jgi:hypothetical protein